MGHTGRRGWSRETLRGRRELLALWFRCRRFVLRLGFWARGSCCRRFCLSNDNHFSTARIRSRIHAMCMSDVITPKSYKLCFGTVYSLLPPAIWSGGIITNRNIISPFGRNLRYRQIRALALSIRHKNAGFSANFCVFFPRFYYAFPLPLPHVLIHAAFFAIFPAGNVSATNKNAGCR